MIARRRFVPLFAYAFFATGCTDGVQNAVPSPWFKDEAHARGLDFRHFSGFEGRHLLPEIMGGGAALADIDGDGDLDAYLVQSGSLYEATNTQADARTNRLYINDGVGRFAEAPTDRGASDDGYGMGVASGDYDNDGDVDLYVTNFGPNVLLRNDGTGRFEDVSSYAGVDDPGFSTAAAFLDLDGDGYLDLLVVNYVNWSFAAERNCYSGSVLTYCAPTSYGAPAADHLFRNNRDGTFTDFTVEAGMSRVFGNGLGALGADFDLDGRTDLFVANDMTVNQLWMNREDFRFVDDALYRGCAVDSHGAPKAGMGVASGDLDDDGDPDLLVVNLTGQTDSYYRNEGTHFSDATAQVGLGTASRRHTRFGVALADFDNDGRLDIYEANGRVASNNLDPDKDGFAEPNSLYRGGRRFAEVHPLGGTAEPLIHTSRGLAIGDVDDDGGLDLLVVNRDAAPYLLMNRIAKRGNWIRFRVVSRHGRDAHAATVSAVVGDARRYRDVDPEGSYLSASDPRVHIGIGEETTVRDVNVQWPWGELEAFGDFEAGRVYELVEGAGTPQS